MYIHAAEERVNRADMKSLSSAQPICGAGPWLAAGNPAVF